MDIRHLRYFIAIVENEFNLTKTSQILYISQPTLSMMITEFEMTEGVQIFNRKKGKIIGLTYLGENYYNDAKDVIHRYTQMKQNLHKITKDITGNISIGIPPLILSVVFSEAMPNLILKNPNINFRIREEGAFALKNRLLSGEVDLAVLLQPTHLSKNIIESFEILHSELAVFCSKNHHINHKDTITWQDLHNQKIAIFDETFMIHHQLQDIFDKNNIYPNIILESSSWDFLLNSAKINNDLITILPYPIATLYPNSDFVCKKIQNPLPWKVTLCRLKKEHYGNIENYIFNSILKEFKL